MVKDVVCGMEINEKTSKWKTEYKGKTYYFCGPMCKLEFDENPEKYLPTDSQAIIDSEQKNASCYCFCTITSP